MKKFGTHLRTKRLELLKEDKSFSLRRVSQTIGIEPSYLSKIERGQPLSLSEEKIVALAQLLQEDTDYLLAMGGKISQDVQAIIKERPMLFSRLVREMKDMPDEAIAEDQDFKRLNSVLHRLHGLASIGAFQLCDSPEKSFWTSQVPSMLGLNSDALPSREILSDSLAPRSRTKWEEAIRSAMRDQGEYECELHAGATDRPRHLRIWGYCDTGDDGQPRYAGIIQDITEQVSLREQILAARDSLELTVEQQNVEISTAIREMREEVARRKELEAELLRINEAITEKADQQNRFFKQSAFKLRSLITGLYSELPTHSHVGGSYFRRISAKINDLSDYFLGAANIKASRSPCVPADIITETMTMFEKEADKKSLSLASHTAPDVPHRVSLDRNILERVLIVLLELFCSHTPWGQIQTVLSANTAERRLTVAISSTSLDCPISDQDLTLTPASFPRSQCPGDARLVAPLLECLGGHASIQTSATGGHCVVLDIPYEPAEETKAQEVFSHEPVLVVEDDESSRTFVEILMKQGKYKYLSAETGKRAMELLERHSFGLVLMDIQLPDINGEDIVKRIRKGTGPNNDTPVVAVTAHATREDRERFLSSGIDEVVAKPYEIETLMHMVGVWYKNDQRQRGACHSDEASPAAPSLEQNSG
ncbi:response regulator [Salidesulfovibrio brasiliensis]|uniref:response regulator n=1 Tax=Salidesulfovibrio brasiliensis TaxID=221711 RepID=UPI0009F8F9F6|nr:response regulator [Salidesulfovibrio brasiliensis]